MGWNSPCDHLRDLSDEKHHLLNVIQKQKQKQKQMPETEIWKMPFKSMADTETPKPEMCAGEEEAKAQEQRQCANSHQAGEYL